MISASQYLWRLTHAVATDCVDREIFTCWICGGDWTRGVLRYGWAGANFTGQNRVRCIESEIVCEPCVVAMAGRPPDTLRMYSHLVEVGSKHEQVNKGQKPRIREFLRGPHPGEWFAAIADSGKKHVIPWTPVNPARLAPGTGRVMLEERLVALGNWQLVDDLTVLLTAGASKETAETGEYNAGAWAICGNEIRAFEARWSGERASDWWALALWLAQRDEAVVEARQAKEKEAKNAKRDSKRAAAKSDGGRATRGKGGVPTKRREPAHTLGHAAKPPTSERTDERERRRVVDAVRAVAPAGGAQCSLFGSADGSLEGD
jgi:hypothetical protein